MAVSHALKTVATTALALNTADAAGHTLYLFNTDAAVDVFLGASNVTAATGVKFVHATALTLNLKPGDVLYAISASSAVVGVLSV